MSERSPGEVWDARAVTDSQAPYVSPDGRWRWNGTQWVPNEAGYGVPPQPAPGYGPAPAGGYGQPYGGPASYGYLPLPPAPAHDGKAIGSLVASLLGLFCGIGSVVGVILGHLSRSEAKRQGREPSGLALAGLIIGYVGIALLLAILSVFLVGGVVTESVDTSTTLCPQQPSGSC
jgi:hypothetical protein